MLGFAAILKTSQEGAGRVDLKAELGNLINEMEVRVTHTFHFCFGWASERNLRNSPQVNVDREN
jgi:hypothetical protein